MDKDLYDDINNILDKEYPDDLYRISYKDIRSEFMGLSDKAKLYLSNTLAMSDFYLKHIVCTNLWAFYVLCIGYMYIDEYKDGLHIYLILIVARDIEMILDMNNFDEDDRDTNYIDLLEFLQSEQSTLYNRARQDIIAAMGDAKCGDEYKNILDRCESTIPKDIPDILDVYNLFGENIYWIKLLNDYKPADYPEEYVYI